MIRSNSYNISWTGSQNDYPRVAAINPTTPRENLDTSSNVPALTRLDADAAAEDSDDDFGVEEMADAVLCTTEVLEDEKE